MRPYHTFALPLALLCLAAPAHAISVTNLQSDGGGWIWAEIRVNEPGPGWQHLYLDGITSLGVTEAAGGYNVVCYPTDVPGFDAFFFPTDFSGIFRSFGEWMRRDYEVSNASFGYIIRTDNAPIPRVPDTGRTGLLLGAALGLLVACRHRMDARG